MKKLAAQFNSAPYSLFATVVHKLHLSNPALSGSDRHDFAPLQGLDITNWGPAKESPVLAIELAGAFVTNLERRTCRIQFPREHALPRGMQAKLLLKLQRTH